MRNQPFIIPLCGIILGILTTRFSSELNQTTGMIGVGAMFFIGLIFYLINQKTTYISILFFFWGLGWGTTLLHEQKPKLQKSQMQQKQWVQLCVKESYKSSEKFKKHKATILQIDSLPIQNTHALLYWNKSNTSLFPSDTVWIFTKILPTQSALNPYQFDYAQFLQRKGINYTVFSDTTHYQISSGNSIQKKIEIFKTSILQKMIKNGYSDSTTELVGAMLLGSKDDMNQERLEQYRKTGVVHILSISGLHVMMVYSVFLILFYPLLFFPKGKVIQIVLSLLSIWGFAYFVGLQPSVVRSAMMISIYHLAVIFSRKPNVYHTLAISAFLLLLWNPNNLYDIGFQLSFSAVFFIVWLNPIFTRLIQPKSKLSKITVGFVGTSISAQLGTFPLSAYYFHQTSGLFLAGNVAMVMASYFLIVGGMLSITLIFIGLKPSFWIHLFNEFITLCNDYIQWLSGFDFLIFERISFRLLDVLFLFIGIVLLRFLFLKKNVYHRVLFLSVIVLFETHRFYENYTTTKKEELIIFHQNRNSIIGVRDGVNMDVFLLNLEDSLTVKNYIIKPYEVHEGIKSVKFLSINDTIWTTYFKSTHFIYWKEKTIYLAYHTSSEVRFKFDYLLLQNNTKPTSGMIHDSVLIILDGSNYPNHLDSSALNIWRTREKGAFRITE